MSDSTTNDAANPEVQQRVREILEDLGKRGGLEPLKELFWTALSYQRVDQPISARKWSEKAQIALAEEPVLFATGANGGFPIIYIRLSNAVLSLNDERLVVTQLLKDHLDALFVFSNAAQNTWHFLNVKPELEHAHTRRRLFRRITVGPEERLRTASERIALLDMARLGEGASRFDVLEEHERAFDVEAVTKRFFAEYQVLFRMFQKDLSKRTGDETWAHDYALQFLNRCMFLYFIQRKGWLGNDKEFLLTLWETYKETPHEQDTFFEQWLKVLFLEAFNKKFAHGTHRHFPQHILTILATAPYLNGGLFSENQLDKPEHTFVITDARFESALLFFEKFNFTISEDSPLDQEVAVDPEMIGKVYESLVNVSEGADERSDAGIFYTPRTEIDLMCRLSLVDYLANRLGQDKKDVLYDAIFALEPEEKSSADDRLSDIDMWQQLRECLQHITIVDPACGSGSFLVGMLYVVDDLQERANERLYIREDTYTRKKRIIGDSLYGVDVMEWAAHIAELRLWLTLIVDAQFAHLEELHTRQDPLLPHLSFKVRYGDSLLQEVGGINMGFTEKTRNLPTPLKQRLARLKNDKLDFYHNYTERHPKSKAQLEHEELQFFHAVLNDRIHTKQERKKRLELGPVATQISMEALLADETPQWSGPTPEERKEIERLEREITDLQKARGTLTTPKDVPFVWDIAFAEVFADEKSGFDIVIGNPPYVRQEQIADPHLPRDEAMTPGNKQVYKGKLARSVYQAFPEFFGYRHDRDKATHPLDAKSDLYIYFYLYGLRLLNSYGSFCFITSNSWLDVGYGADLQEFLLTTCHVKMILDNHKRSFASADVNTIIALFSAPNEKAEHLQKIARFIMFSVPFEHVLTADIFKELESTQQRTTTPDYRLSPILQLTLLEEGRSIPEVEALEEASAKTTAKVLVKETQSAYTGNKWGGKYLRAPDIYWTIIEKGKDKLVRLGDTADIRFGIKTGANEFFYLDEKKALQWNIENEFLQPVIKSPRECKSILINSSDLSVKVFVCQKDKKDLKGTIALDYIEWGEKRKFHENASVSGRKKWWSLSFETANSIFVKEANDASAVFYNPHNYPVDCRLYYANLSQMTITYLNSAIGVMLFEIYNRAGLGEGARSMMVSDYDQVPILTDNHGLDDYIQASLQQIYTLPPRKVMAPVDSRWVALDSIVFDALNLTQGERDGVYEAVINLVEKRLKKAGSLQALRNGEAKEQRRQRAEAFNNTLGIWAGLPDEEEEEVGSSYA